MVVTLLVWMSGENKKYVFITNNFGSQTSFCNIKEKNSYDVASHSTKCFFFLLIL